MKTPGVKPVLQFALGLLFALFFLSGYCKERMCLCVAVVKPTSTGECLISDLSHRDIIKSCPFYYIGQEEKINI